MPLRGFSAKILPRLQSLILASFLIIHPSSLFQVSHTVR
jgi:hypothetical protein